MDKRMDRRGAQEILHEKCGLALKGRAGIKYLKEALGQKGVNQILRGTL